ncbi:MAG: hypothetical protein JXR49_17640 [Acidobacteria bacterium]|nr:hypothetical protein [Acidobacteriota bacterium]
MNIRPHFSQAPIQIVIRMTLDEFGPDILQFVQLLKKAIKPVTVLDNGTPLASKVLSDIYI